MKKKQPYFPVYAQDILTHPGLVLCTASTYGVYFLLLCILHKQKDPGVYTLADTPQGDVLTCLAAQLGRQMPFETQEIRTALQELIRFELLELNGTALLDKEMIERRTISDIRAAAGTKGALSTNQKHTRETFAEDFAAAKLPANAEYENEYEIENEYDKRIEGVQGEEGETNEKPDTVQRVEDNGFEKLRQAYPRKAEKAAARKAYVARIRDGWSPPELYAAVELYAAQCRAEKREQRYIKHGAVFLGPSTPFADYIPHSPPEDEEDDLKECF